jgi:hypothetical protein
MKILILVSYSQLANLSAKVQAYEDVIRNISLRFGVSDEQLMSNAMTIVGLTERSIPIIQYGSNDYRTLLKARSEVDPIFPLPFFLEDSQVIM